MRSSGKGENTVIRGIAAAAALALMGAGLSPVSFAERASVEPYSVEPAMRAPLLSPDGSKMAYRLAQTKKGDYILEIRDVNDLGKKPVRIGSSEMLLRGFRWLESDHLLIDFEMQVRDQVKGQEQSAFQSRRAIARADGKGQLIPVYDDLNIVSTVPERKNEVLVQTNKFRWEQLGGSNRTDAFDALGSTPDFYWMNVKTGAVRLEFKGSGRFGGYGFDSKGNAQTAAEFDPATKEQVFYYRRTNDDDWREIYRVNVNQYEHRANVLGLDPEIPNGGFVATTRAPDGTFTNFQAVYEIDLMTGKLGEKVFELPNQDVFQTLGSPNPDVVNTVAGFRYYDENGDWQQVYLDQDLQQLQATLDATFPNKRVGILSQSRDEKRMTISVRDYFGPATYYLLTEDGLQMIGESNPAISEDKVHPVEYIEYQARDGRTIPAYVTVPDGEGPHPLIVMPHGGPWVPYRVNGYDEWSQMFADHGYMVIDPLFRGTTGLGTDHWLSSFGEWGKTMSNDMDDGALHLVKEGRVDPDRIAMFGWSFGGYSAFAAAVRSPQIYQCTIPGAGVNDPEVFRAAFSRARSPAQRAQRAQLDVGYAGLSAVDSASEASVPMLVIHGKLDRRVRVFHSRNFVSKLKRNKKPHTYLELETADHFSNYLTYDHKMEMYSAMMDFLENDCGPGGL